MPRITSRRLSDINRPAEKAGAAGAAISAVIAAVLAHNWLAAATGAVGLVPAAVTFLKDNGGLVGLWQIVLHGCRPARRRSSRRVVREAA